MKKEPRLLFKYIFLATIIFILITIVLFVASEKKVKRKTMVKEISNKTVKKLPGKIETQGLIISTVPKDRGFLRRLEQPVYVYFSEKISPKDFSFKFSPDPGKWNVSWRRMGKLAILEHTNPFQAGAGYQLKIVIKSAKKEKIVQFTAYGPSSLDLIAQDEKKKLLDLDTAWTYRLQAIFEPYKLPSKYKSSTPVTCGTGVMRKFKKIKHKLQPETTRKLRPYLVPPSHPESIFLREIEKEGQGMTKKNFNLIPQAFAQGRGPKKLTWGKPLKCSSAPIKIWFHKGFKSQAEEACDYIDMGNYYGKFKDVMSIKPLSDANEQDNGGDGNLDFYMVSLKEENSFEGEVYGICIPYKETRITPAYILINQNIQGADLDATLAHEFFHAFQFAFDSDEEDWWMEGTAVWAEDYADPGHDREQDYLTDAFLVELNRLETLTDDDGLHPYGIYLFPYYLSRQFGDEKIGEIWKSCESKDALNAVEGSVEDFNKQFKKFAYLDSDIGPNKGAYHDTNGPLELYDYHSEKEEKLDPDINPLPEIDVDMPPLSATYYRFYNKCNPDATSHIRFDLNDFQKNDKITVQAIIDPDGKAIEEDWSNRKERSFCINDEEENFKSIALTFANAERTSVVFPTLKIKLDATGCDAAYADITRDDYSITRHEDGGYQEWKTMIQLHITCDDAVYTGIMAEKGGKELILYPIKSTKIKESLVYEKYVSEYRRETHTGKAIQVEIPKTPFLENYEVDPLASLHLYRNLKTGKIEFVFIPEINIKILWDDGREDDFQVEPVTDLDEPIKGMMGMMGLLSKDFLVKSGDGIHNVAGNGKDEYEVRDKGEYEHTKDTFDWKIHVRKRPSKKQD